MNPFLYEELVSEDPYGSEDFTPYFTNVEKPIGIRGKLSKASGDSAASIYLENDQFRDEFGNPNDGTLMNSFLWYAYTGPENPVMNITAVYWDVRLRRNLLAQSLSPDSSLSQSRRLTMEVELTSNSRFNDLSMITFKMRPNVDVSGENMSFPDREFVQSDITISSMGIFQDSHRLILIGWLKSKTERRN